MDVGLGDMFGKGARRIVMWTTWRGETAGPAVTGPLHLAELQVCVFSLEVPSSTVRTRTRHDLACVAFRG